MNSVYLDGFTNQEGNFYLTVDSANKFFPLYYALNSL